uniref:Chromo domain-containing protein n=1 Tax=Cannabis sativa TaxID=3483 RepID=A0A803P658_CANSA
MGLLQPLPIPEKPWQSRNMDFIVRFPEVKGFWSILVVVNRFSKYGIFIPMPNACPADVAAELIMKNVVKYFGLAEDIISYRDSKFTGRSLKVFAQQHTGLQRIEPIAGTSQGQPRKSYKEDKEVCKQASKDLEFFVKDRALLKLTPQIWKKITDKRYHKGLVQKYDGPFEIVQKVGAVAYKLKLQERFKLHPTFHVSFLKKFHEDKAERRQQVVRAPPTVRKQFEKKLTKILDHRTFGASKKNLRTEYLVQWEGEDVADATWEKVVTLWQFEDKVNSYIRSVSTRTSISSSGGDF